MSELEYETRMAEPKFAETYCSHEPHYKLVEARCEELVNLCNEFEHLSNSYEVMAAEAALERLFQARKKAGGDK
jgi:hypothetical protein